ncbi:hypothetical protein [uncultured Lacinutrix sp.]|uniref:hypothetical protein n=1 Tax=uncultured Lacinutrix sp. TaxID=574032 RepID=UPI002630AD59|nr:hypothetical protein [uncultured Lacinutrix sp.]
MSDKKNIDRLFQEKFKDFEMKPNPNLWANIEDQLDNNTKPKKERKTIPVWLRYSGIAATLLLFLVIGNSILNNNNNTESNTTIVDTKTEDKIIRNTSNDENKDDIIKEKENIEGVTENTENNTAISNTNNTDSKSIESNLLSNKNASKALKDKTKNANNLVTSSSKNNYNTSVVSNSNNKSSISNKNKKDYSIVTNENSNYTANAVANNSQNKTISKEKNNDITNSSYSNTTVSSSNTINKNKINTKTGTVLDNNIAISNTDVATTDSKKEEEKNNTEARPSYSNTTVASSNTINKNKTNTKTVPVLDNNIAISNTDVATTDSEKEEEKMIEKESEDSSESIEEAIAKIEDLDEKEKEANKWTVNANVAPVYYNTLGKGSHIHDQFIDNPKSGEVNTSYGVKVGYALNKKLKVRTGVNMLDLSYDTANVLVYDAVSNAPNNAALRNINFVPDNQGQTFSVLSADNFGVQQVSNLVNKNLNAALSQRLSYVEVPLEMEYALVDNKLGIDVIAGASAFFLGDNEVVSEIDNRKQKIGEANNINDISYSANIGLGIDYKFSDKLQFNFEPTFKYQMNAYSETSGDFRPYIIGVYTGFSYKF